MPLLQFNQAPYSDDFDQSKGFMKVLFKAGVPVQGRELNQIQSIFQNQVTQFANNIFKNGSVVSGARNSLQSKQYVRMNDYVTGSSSVAVDLSQFTEGFKIQGATSGVTALYVTGFNSTTSGDPPTAYLVYTGTGTDGSTTKFIPGEVLNWIDSNGIVVYNTTVRCPGCAGSSQTDTIPPLGIGQIYTVDEGTFYYEGLFLPVSRQMFIVTPYLVKKVDISGNVVIDDTTLSDGTIPPPPCKIGLDFVQKVVTYQDDPSLLDPSLGYPNSTAPGADRFQCQLILNKRGYSDADGDDFIPLCLIGTNMSITYQAMESEYNTIQDVIAQQFYETDGNYSLAPFKISFYESKKNSTIDAQGWSTTGSDADLVCLVQPSVAYVNGYRCAVQAPTPILFPKARDTNSVKGYITQFPERTYIVAQPTTAKIWPNDDGDMSMVSARVVNLKDSGGTTIGTAYVNDMKLHKTITTSGQFNQYRYYIYNLQMGSGQVITNVASVATDSGFSANVIPDPVSTKVQLYNPNNQALVYALSKPNVKTIRDNDNNQNGSLQVAVRQKLTGVLDSSGSITFSAATNQAFMSADAFTVIYVNVSGTYNVVDPTVSGVYNSTGTSLTIHTAPAGGGTGWASKPITVLATILYTSQKEIQKVLTAGTYTTSVQPNFGLGQSVSLPVSDVVDFTAMWVQSGGAQVDVTSEYSLVTGINDFSYTTASIVRNTGPTASETTINSADRLQVTYNYYVWNGSQGWSTVDSYPVDSNINPSAINNPIDYEDLGSFTLSTSQIIPINQAIDFRPQLPSSYPEGTASVVALLPAMGSTAVFDITYYLGREDLLQLSKDNILYIKLGTSSETPKPPVHDPNSLGLWTITLKPYTYSLADVSMTPLASKVYRMSDIANLESRIANLEYYTALTLLEQTASSMQVTDSSGLNRFKNGFVADNFSDFQVADLTSVEFRAAHDTQKQMLRPRFKTRNKKLIVDRTNSSGFTFIGSTAIAAYTETKIVGNAYATKSISINPYLVYDQTGTMQLSPNNDTWSDDTILPAITVTADSGMDPINQVTDPGQALGTVWGSWPSQNTTIPTTTTPSTTSQYGDVVGGAGFITPKRTEED